MVDWTLPAPKDPRPRAGGAFQPCEPPGPYRLIITSTYKREIDPESAVRPKLFPLETVANVF